MTQVDNYGEYSLVESRKMAWRQRKGKWEVGQIVEVCLGSRLGDEEKSWRNALIKKKKECSCTTLFFCHILGYPSDTDTWYNPVESFRAFCGQAFEDTLSRNWLGVPCRRATSGVQSTTSERSSSELCSSGGKDTIRDNMKIHLTLKNFNEREYKDASQFKTGDVVEIRDPRDYENFFGYFAVIIDTCYGEVHVHFLGLEPFWNSWISIDALLPLGSGAELTETEKKIVSEGGRYEGDEKIVEVLSEIYLE